MNTVFELIFPAKTYRLATTRYFSTDRIRSFLRAAFRDRVAVFFDDPDRFAVHFFGKLYPRVASAEARFTDSPGTPGLRISVSQNRLVIAESHPQKPAPTVIFDGPIFKFTRAIPRKIPDMRPNPPPGFSSERDRDPLNRIRGIARSLSIIRARLRDVDPGRARTLREKQILDSGWMPRAVLIRGTHRSRRQLEPALEKLSLLGEIETKRFGRGECYRINPEYKPVFPRSSAS